MAFLYSLSFLCIALPLSSAFVTFTPRNVPLVPSSSRLFATSSTSSNTLEVSSTVTIATLEEEEAMYSDFPSLDDMELSPQVEPKTPSLTTTRHSIQVTQVMNAASLSETTSSRSFPPQQQENSFSFDKQHDEFAPKETRLVSNSPSSRLMQEAPPKQRRVTAKVRETGYDSMQSYIKTMCNHELLQKNEEVILAREIQILMKWEQHREELEAQLLRYVMLYVYYMIIICLFLYHLLTTHLLYSLFIV